MDKRSLVTKWVVITFMVVIGAIGFRVASIISEANMYIARGALGCAFIYLLFREVNFVFKDEPFENLFNFSHIRDYIWTFVLFAFFYWALNEVIQLILYVIRSFVIAGRTP